MTVADVAPPSSMARNRAWSRGAEAAPPERCGFRVGVAPSRDVAVIPSGAESRVPNIVLHACPLGSWMPLATSAILPATWIDTSPYVHTSPGAETSGVAATASTASCSMISLRSRAGWAMGSPEACERSWRTVLCPAALVNAGR